MFGGVMPPWGGGGSTHTIGSFQQQPQVFYRDNSALTFAAAYPADRLQRIVGEAQEMTHGFDKARRQVKEELRLSSCVHCRYSHRSTYDERWCKFFARGKKPTREEGRNRYKGAWSEQAFNNDAVAKVADGMKGKSAGAGRGALSSEEERRLQNLRPRGFWDVMNPSSF
uniref:Uncharacterized protein n=1 Tax=Chromera velia CCMP2878 TaxID=1169474 RepID=A0A0G4I3E9_9ALVE|eukprot:Cvel_35455.t1-p1 / transcript=Cvel_35455.t1 / gene=Cvel_35455 / organism=Chromera_velia_CCMP2878 / gene_product=hypothetical protein / transcript_product=hypothetical protein / location=Cvel_scaffold6485:742-1245(-) / protein_length=168 / sequence_SO=supercontig / SO=protein_coding / is_pseudo=false